MTDWPLPPFVEPRGPQGTDEQVLEAFLSGDIAPHSARLHVEGPVLMVDRDMPFVLRLSHDSVLVRVDVPDDVVEIRDTIQGLLTAHGLEMLDEESLLGIAVGVQLVGLRASTWDLWGTDIDVAFAALREAARGGDDSFPGAGI